MKTSALLSVTTVEEFHQRGPLTCDDVLDGAVLLLPHLRGHLSPLQLGDQVHLRQSGLQRTLKQKNLQVHLDVFVFK